MLAICAVWTAIALSRGQAADVRIEVGEVKDTRSTGGSSGLDIELKLSGDDLRDAKWFRSTVVKAVDDTGRALVPGEEERVFFNSDFDNYSFEQTHIPRVTLRLKTPARRATVVKDIAGEVEIFRPALDPNSVVDVRNAFESSMVAVSNPTLASAQIQVAILTKEQFDKAKKAAETTPPLKARDDKTGEETFKTMAKAFADTYLGNDSKNRVILWVRDPQSKLLKTEFLDATEKVIQPTMSGGESGRSRMCSYEFANPLPKETRLRLYVATPQSIIKVPLEFKDIALP
jgi:hypothetical protein